MGFQVGTPFRHAIRALRSADKSGKVTENLVRRHEIEGNHLARSRDWLGNGQR
jgi:hypothetical protein